MHGDICRFVTQPAMAVSAMLVAAVTLAGAAIAQVDAGGVAHVEADLMLASTLGIAVVLGYQFPIYIRHNTKIYLISAALLLGAAFLPPFLAGCLAAVSLTAGEFSVMSRRGTRLVDIATMTGRWTVAVVLASLIVHIVPSNAAPLERGVSFVAAAFLMWVMDVLLAPLVITPINNEHPLAVIAGTVREGGALGLAQYVLGVTGIIVAFQNRWAIMFLLIPTALVYMAFNKRLDPDTLQLLETMADNMDLRGTYTVGHSRRVRDLVADILVELDVGGQEGAQILTASRLHDVGRVGLPPELLISSGSLTTGQQAQLESYPELGVELMREFPDFSRGLEMIRHHHERWDGMGYPDKLTGTEIPFGARVIAVADAFDAMTSERPYRRAFIPEQAARVLVDGAGHQWDPTVVAAFLRSVGSPFADEVLGAQPDGMRVYAPDSRRQPA